jgi:hypothetical protein
MQYTIDAWCKIETAKSEWDEVLSMAEVHKSLFYRRIQMANNHLPITNYQSPIMEARKYLHYQQLQFAFSLRSLRQESQGLRAPRLMQNPNETYEKLH